MGNRWVDFEEAETERVLRKKQKKIGVLNLMKRDAWGDSIYE